MQPKDFVVKRVIQSLEEGQVPSRKPWSSEMPRNIDGREYRGLNVFILACAGYSNPFWLTYTRARKLGGFVMAEEKGTPVLFWKLWEPKRNRREDDDKRRVIPLARIHHVFNVEQCKLPSDLVPKWGQSQYEPSERAEAILTAMPNSPVRKGSLRGAGYSPSKDTIFMPDPKAFESTAEYYSTLFHELGHATGHPDRLHRFEASAIVSRDDDYSFEELVAEFVASFLCGRCGIASDTENEVAYLQNWAARLKANPEMVLKASRNAPSAVDFILNTQFAEKAEAA